MNFKTIVGAVCACMAVVPLNASAINYIIINIGSFGGDYSEASDINNSGHVAGYSTIEDGNSSTTHAFLYDGNRMQDIGTLGGPHSTYGYGINDTGQITGASSTPVSSHAFIYDGKSMQDLGSLGGISFGNGINNNGQVVGSTTLTADNSGSTHAFLYDGSTMQDLGTLGGERSSAADINTRGQITGNSTTSSGESHAFVYFNGTMKDIGTPGVFHSSGSAINDVGHVTGTSASNAFYYDGTTTHDLGTLGGNSSWGDDINNHDQIVGTSRLSNNSSVAFLYDSGVMYELCELADCISQGWSTLTYARAINDNGDIVGQGVINGVQRAYIALVDSDGDGVGDNLDSIKNWTCIDGSWDDDTCWSPFGQPETGEVFITPSDDIDRTITFSNLGAPVKTGGLYIDATGTGVTTFAHIQGELDTSGETVNIGANGVAMYNQSGGFNNAGGVLLGVATGKGTYNLTGGSLGTYVTEIGSSNSSGVGLFNQYVGSSHHVQAGLIIYKNSTYNLFGGNLGTTNADLSVREGGEFNQSGGINSNRAEDYGLLVRGIYNLTDGTFDYGRAVVSSGGVFNQTDGISRFNVFRDLNDGLASISGTYNLSGGVFESNQMEVNKGGVFNVTGGTFEVEGAASIGTDGAGNFKHSGGSSTVGTLFVGGEDGTGTYDFSTGSIVARGSTVIGENGTFNQSGGTLYTGNELVIDTGGTFNISGGELDGPGQDIRVAGIFNQTGGSVRAVNISLNGGHYIFNDGRLAVERFNGNLINNGGTLAPGNSPGSTEINGDYTQTGGGSFEVEISGNQQGSDYDWLNITGNAVLDGTLDVGLGSGSFRLGEGNVFDILSAESITGEFDRLRLVTLEEGLEWDVSYLTDVSGTTDLVRLTVNRINALPTANAGFDQVVSENNAVNLNGTGSSDSDGDIASYSWTQTAGTNVALSGANTAFLSFVAPPGSGGTTLTFALLITDNDGGSAEDFIDIVVSNVNGLPTAIAGADQIVNEGSVVNLDGRASFDGDGVINEYSWLQTAGTSVEINGANTATPSFTVPSVISDSVLIFTLEVIDDNGDTDTASITITVNDALLADAGTDQQITEGDIVQLNGLNSFGIDSTIGNYLWMQTEGPAVILNNRTSATTHFTAPPVDGTTLLVFKLVVTDSSGSQDLDTVFVNVRDQSSTGVTSTLDVQLINTVVSAGDFYQFDTVSNPFFASTNIQWEQISGPDVTLDNANTVIPSFVAPTVSSDSAMTFEVRSTNIDGTVVRARVNVNVIGTTSVNQAPTANVVKAQIAIEGATVSMDAASSTDSDGAVVAYYWQQTAGPMVMLTSNQQAETSFVAPAIAAVDDSTELTFELVVTDNSGFVDRQTITITVLDNGINAFADDVTAITSSSGDPVGIQPINGGSLVALKAIDPATITDAVNRPDALPYGLLDFSVRVEPGATVQVSVVLPLAADSNFTWWKYSDSNGWIDYSDNTAFNTARDVITITLTDNGIGDDDPTPGVIRDPGGLALASASTTDNSSGSDDDGSSGINERVGSGTGSGGSIGALLLVSLLLGFYARTFTWDNKYTVRNSKV